MPTSPQLVAGARALRPAHAVASLPRGSGLLLMSPRDLRRVARDPLVRITVPIPYAVPGILRAARDADVILGLVKPGSALGEGPPAPQFTVGVLHAAEELRLTIPFFLATPPLQLPDDPIGERTAAEIQRWVDAGFTEIVVRGQTIRALGAPRAMGTIREREIPLCVSAEDPARLAEVLRGVPDGVELDLVKLWSTGEGDLPGGGLEVPAPAPEGVSLKGLDLSAVVMETAERILGAVPAAKYSWDVEQLSQEALEKLEALVYVRLMDAFEEAGLAGSATRTLEALAADPGY